MDIQALDVIADQLQQQQATIIAKEDTLRAELAQLEDRRGRIEAALAALSGVASPAANAKKKQETRKVFAPSAKKLKVIALITDELSQHNTIQEEELKARIEQKLVETGYARMGYSLRFKEALADSQFIKSEMGVSLKKALPLRAQQGG